MAKLWTLPPQTHGLTLSDKGGVSVNINIKLDKSFTTELNKLRNEYSDELTKLNGLSDVQLSYTDFLDNFIDKQTVADASIDGNANVGTKDVCSLESEMSKPHSKLIAFNKIYYEIKKKYGKSVADKWMRCEWDGHFYLHDFASSSTKPYCFAYDIEGLVTKGLYFIDNFNAQPPKHLVTYTDFVGEFVSWTSNRTSGACGIPSFLVYSYYFWKRDVDNGYYTGSPEIYRNQEFQRIIYKLNQPYLRVNQSAFTNFSIFDKPYLEAVFGGKEFPDGTFIIDYIDDILEYQKRFMEVLGEIRDKNMMTFPVMSYSLLRIDGKFVDEDFAKWCCRHNMKWADSNFLVSSDITSLSNCCRLVSDVATMGYFNSIGGTALEVGSVKVNTLNLARIAYETTTEDEYLEALEDLVCVDLQALDCVRHIIERNIEKNLLPNYSKGVMSIKSQYNTIGIIGLYETLEEFGYTRMDQFGNTFYTDEGLSFAKKILKKITDVKNEFVKDKDYLVNIEQIPAERAAAVLMEKDKLFYPNKTYKLPLYGNQWIPLGVKTTIHEKVRLSAELDKACSGGGISHINIDAPFSNFETAWDMLNYVADQGVVYFAFCVRISTCKNNHAFYGKTCPHCGELVETTWQRIVGFLTPEKNYSKERKQEFKMRDWFALDTMREM